MGRIEIRPFADTRDEPAGGHQRSQQDSKLTPEQLACSVRRYHEGGDDLPQMIEVTVPPGITIPSHAHEEPEIIYVTEGELRFGSQALPARSSVFVPGNTLYSFTAGPDGARFLNFRPCRVKTYITKDEFVARRRPSAE